MPRLQYSRSDDDEEPRNRRAGIRDVAQLAGVAVSSASRVLSDHPDVSPAMRRRVLEAVAQLGYEPDFLAQSLRRGATYTIGFVTRDISSPLLAEIALGAERALRAAAYTMLVLNSEGDPVLDARHLRLLERRRTDGLLVSLADETHPEALAALRALTVPAVLIDRDVADAPGLGAVLADHEGGMRAVVSHLASLGHRVVGLAAGPTQVRPGREAARVFRECCSEFGIAARAETGPFDAGYGFDAATRMLDAPDAPTALIAGSNQIFPGVFRAVCERRLRIPEELSLVTFDDQPLLGLLSPAIDVVRRGPQAFGQTAAELLLRQLGGERVSSVLVPTVYERRGSSAPPPHR